MSLSAKIREQLISSFRAELAEHIQTMTNGLLALEQGQVSGEGRQSSLAEIFRAAHSLKGAARAVGVTAVEQLAHGLEDVLDAMQRDAIELTSDLFTACYQALDAIQLVQSAYESGATTPPSQVLKALAELEPFRGKRGEEIARQGDGETGRQGDKTQEAEGVEREAERVKHETESVEPGAEGVGRVVESVGLEAATTDQQPVTSNQQPATSNQQRVTSNEQLQSPISNLQSPDETIRVSVSKLDALMAQLSELLVTKIRAEQRLTQVRQAQELMAGLQKDWLATRNAYSRLARQARDWTTIVSIDMEKAPGGRQALPVPRQEQTGRMFNGNGRYEKEVACLLHYVETSQERLREMGALIDTLSREYANDTMQMSLVIDTLEGEIKRARMLPLSTINGTFGRMVRDLAHAAGKEAILEIVGSEVELDKRVLEQIKDPLIHLLRNAIDHGLETPEQREAAGKPRAGTIRLTAEQLGKDVVICVSDDGAGLDIEALRRAAVRRGVEDAQVMSEAELADLIFNAGFSTSPIVTDVSGRGVGLDVVHRNVEALHGRIGLEWEPGAGTTFTLTLPLTLTSSRGLVVHASGQQFAVPLNFVEHILDLEPERVTSLGGHDALQYNSRPLPLVRLSEVLGLPRRNGQGNHEHPPVVVLAAAEKRIAFVVDELAGEQEIVIKGLGKQLTRVGGITGATVIGNGDVVLILNVADLIRLAQRSDFGSFGYASTGRREPQDRSRISDSGSAVEDPKSEIQNQKSERRILVVDDSITTRTLEKNILEAAGYAVQLATDGQEALSAISADGVPNLIISDIVMPRMDGFDLTQRIKDDARTASVPVILVTSLDSPEDKARGIEVGADAYIVKSGFDQSNLLRTIEQLI